MYLRLGWVTGQAGLLGAIGIVLLSHVITGATGLSVSAIATNRIVGAGGAYNIISRSLGAPVGAAVGIPLFLAQALSVTFYIVGFTEALSAVIPGLDVRLWGSVVLIGLVVVSAKSAELAIKSQYLVMAAIAASLVSLVAGGLPDVPHEVQWINTRGESFGTVFAVFFPAVTGIMAGVGMSGDLRDPQKDLPRGTMAAIAVGLLVYLALPVWLAVVAPPHQLVNDSQVVWNIARWPLLISLGVWGATLSSAVGSILTAPRTLQALANDGLAPEQLGRGSGPNNDPLVGLAVTFALAEAGILLGDLNAIAPILTMFFLATYGLTNLACGLEQWAASPSFRPAFKAPAIVSLGGAAACFYVMSVINLPAMAMALAICAAIFFVTERRDLEVRYGDARHGVYAALVRHGLLKMRQVPYNAGNWRPNLVVLGGHPQERPWLLQMGTEVVGQQGMMTYHQLLLGSVEDNAGRRAELMTEVNDYLSAEAPSVFYRADVCSDLYAGIVAVAQSSGIGPLQANSVMIGWTQSRDHAVRYTATLRDLAGLNRSLMLVRWDPQRGVSTREEIHLWWGGLQGNGGLMLLIAQQILAHPAWRGGRLTIITVVETTAQQTQAQERLHSLLESARMRARVDVRLRERRLIPDLMAEVSGDADLAILGIGLPETDADAEPFFDRINSMLDGMPTTLLVHSARDFESEPVLFAESD